MIDIGNALWSNGFWLVMMTRKADDKVLTLGAFFTEGCADVFIAAMEAGRRETGNTDVMFTKQEYRKPK